MARPKRLAMSNIEASVGGRQALVDTLAAGALSEKHITFLTKLADPLRARDSLQAICTEDGIMLSELLMLLKDASVAQGMVEAMRIGGAGLPSVMEDIVRKGVDRKVKCRRCGGKGEVIDTVLKQPNRTCLECGGSGYLWKESDFDRQKLLGDWMGLGPKKGGVSVNVGVNQQVGMNLPGGNFSKLVRDTDTAAYDVSPPKELPSAESGPEAAVTDATVEETD
jgi:hypothetical protein